MNRRAPAHERPGIARAGEHGLRRLECADVSHRGAAEVFQEILHRYFAIRRPDAIQAAFDALHGVVDEIFSVELADVEQAKSLMLNVTSLSARDAVHAAIMKRRGVRRLMSLDAGFDALPWVERIGR